MIDLSTFDIQSTWLRSDRQAQARTLLAVFAHPDDESFGPGGVLAKYSAEGVNVHYACATRGEAGEADAELLQGHTSLGDLRWRELECAAQWLGLTGLHYLGYRDSGMPGSPDNEHPNALARAESSVLVGQLVALVRALRPQVVLTFDPHGGYNHPDHIAIHRAARQAFFAAGDAGQYPEQLASGLSAYAPQKLYYTAFSTTILRASVFLMRLMGHDPTRLGRNQDINLVEIAYRGQHITTRVDISRYYELKERAAACHRSQSRPSRSPFARLPKSIQRKIWSQETFTRAHPPADRRTRESDLFSGVA